MTKYIDPNTGEQVVPVRHRPSLLATFAFIVILGLFVWALIPKNHALVSFSTTPESQNVNLDKAPAGSVSGVGSVPPEVAPSSVQNSTLQNPVTTPSDSKASAVHPAPSPNPGP
jgi:hypothetical protein